MVCTRTTLTAGDDEEENGYVFKKRQRRTLAAPTSHLSRGDIMWPDKEHVFPHVSMSAASRRLSSEVRTSLKERIVELKLFLRGRIMKKSNYVHSKSSSFSDNTKLVPAGGIKQADPAPRFAHRFRLENIHELLHE